MKCGKLLLKAGKKAGNLNWEIGVFENGWDNGSLVGGVD
jgi:hypothetical protein